MSTVKTCCGKGWRAGKGKTLEQLGFFLQHPNLPCAALPERPQNLMQSNQCTCFSFLLKMKFIRDDLLMYLKLRLNVLLLPFLCEISFQIQYSCTRLKALCLLGELRVSGSKLGKYNGHILFLSEQYSDFAVGCCLCLLNKGRWSIQHNCLTSPSS